jgi:prolyl-tRNA editing enzyme YbaK/EbsC (Cys-tRNA(Pro) deacylase)
VAKGVDRFTQATAGLDLQITLYPEGTHTAQDAAAAVGAPVGAIVKSLVFMAGEQALMVLASGPNRVGADLIGRALGLTLIKADADQVRNHTGFSIGGVPPIGHPTSLQTVMDRDLFDFDEVWAAAGSSSAVFSISPLRLQELSNATVISVA